MRELFKSEVGKWQEATDAQKHVFEVRLLHSTSRSGRALRWNGFKDIGIATFLMLLWKYRCPPRVGYVASEDVGERPWEEWPRPQAGFTDLGCVTHSSILS